MIEEEDLQRKLLVVHSITGFCNRVVVELLTATEIRAGAQVNKLR